MSKGLVTGGLMNGGEGLVTLGLIERLAGTFSVLKTRSLQFVIAGLEFVRKHNRFKTSSSTASTKIGEVTKSTKVLYSEE